MVRRAFVSALQAGAFKAHRQSLTTVEWNTASRCEAPKVIELFARPGRRVLAGREVGKLEDGTPLTTGGVFKERERGVALTVRLSVRCRQCRRCLNQRRMIWQERAKTEIAMSSRTWFGTLTFAPSERAKLIARAFQSCQRSGSDWHNSSEKVRWKFLVEAGNAELTKFLKRLRKASKATLRYVAVAEPHKDGLPHFHLLLHERWADQPVPKALLEQKWAEIGFSAWRLVRDDLRANAAGYVTKYISKVLGARVRASKDYGNAALAQAPLIEGEREHLTTPFLWGGRRGGAKPPPLTRKGGSA